MPKAHALLAGSGVGTPAVRTFLDLDSMSDGGALLHALWRAHRVQGVGLAAGASNSGAVLITSDPHRSRLPFAPHAFDLVRVPSAFRNASALFELDRVVRPGGVVVAAAPAWPPELITAATLLLRWQRTTVGSEGDRWRKPTRRGGAAPPLDGETGRALLHERHSAASSGRLGGDASCAELLARHEAYKRNAPCPRLPKDLQPAYQLTYRYPRCEAPPTARQCVEPIPFPYVEPHLRNFRVKGAEWVPPAASIDWAAFPQQLHAKTGLPVAAHRPEDGWAPLSTRTRGDCLGCWKFVEDLDKWVSYANATLVPVGVGGPSVRTLLDLGAGTGALAEVLWRKYGVRGAVGISRDWAGLPFMETMGSRGVLGVEADIFAPLPFPPASFDVVHSSFSGPRYAPSPAAFDAFFVEVDRVLRPGGFVVFTHWMLDGGMLDGHIDDVEARFLEIAARLKWARHQFGVFKGEHREINLRFEKRGGRGS